MFNDAIVKLQKDNMQLRDDQMLIVTIFGHRSSRKRCGQRKLLSETKSPGLTSGASVSFETASLFKNEK